MEFSSQAAHREFLATQAIMPRGFRAATTTLPFVAREVGKPARMNLTLLLCDQPTESFAALFTRNALAGAPVLVGRGRLAQPALSGVVINNKISNVGVATGVADAEAVCRAVAQQIGVPSGALLPSSTGVIGWRLPVDEMAAAASALTAGLSGDSLLPAAQAIMTTDLFPKVRRATCGGGSVVAFGKGAGMIEPHLATMLVFVVTDLAVPRDHLRAALARATDGSFARISIDSDTSTSDMVVALSSGCVPCPDLTAFDQALQTVCSALAADIVRNGEGVHHVISVSVRGLPDEATARAIGKAVVNAPLVKTAICGNDPNVGRLLMAIGKQLGLAPTRPGTPAPSLDHATVKVGGHTVFSQGHFTLSQSVEHAVTEHLRTTELYRSAPNTDGEFHPSVDYPPHERCVQIEIDLAGGPGESTVLGCDLSHEYITENADYRS